MAMLGGGMVPLGMMPGWLAPVSALSPVSWALTALEGALWRDLPASDAALPCSVLSVAGAASLALGVRFLSRAS